MVSTKIKISNAVSTFLLIQVPDTENEYACYVSPDCAGTQYSTEYVFDY